MKELLEALRMRDPSFSDPLLRPLLSYLLKAREVAGGDLDLNIILLVIAIRAVEHPEFSKLSLSERLEQVAAFPTLGVNTHSISESSGIPRETVRRKVGELVRKGWIVRNGTNLHFTSKAFAELTSIREAREDLAIRCYELIRDEAAKLPATPS